MATRVFIDSNLTFTAANNDLQVIGRSGGTEKLVIQSGVTGVLTDGNVERLELAGNLADYKFIAVAGTGIVIQNSAGTVVNTISSINQASTVAFADGSAELLQTGGSSFSLGGIAVSKTAAASVSVTNLNITDKSTVNPIAASGANVFAAGTSDASTANKVYTIAAGTYTYNITGFGAGDVLSFPTGNVPSVSNDSFTDGVVDLTWSYGGNAVTIHLTGISAANEALLNSSANFNTVFGTGTLI